MILLRLSEFNTIQETLTSQKSPLRMTPLYKSAPSRPMLPIWFTEVRSGSNPLTGQTLTPLDDDRALDVANRAGTTLFTPD